MDNETPSAAFKRIIREVLGRAAFECDEEITPLQTVCLSYLRSEQAWLNDMLRTRHVRQPGLIYGFYESPEGEFQAYAIEKATELPGFIAVSSYCVVSLGFFFRSALAHGNILVDFGDPKQEMSKDETSPTPHPFAKPRDPDRLLIAKLLMMMAMRFLTAHEMTHILNGHLRHRLGAHGQNSISEMRQKLSPGDALFSQTLEMDADSGAVVDCMPFVILAERAPEEIHPGCHPVYQRPEAALRLWLFAVYGICWVMEDASPSTSIPESSHPSPMMRVQMIAGTLLEFLKRDKLDRLIGLLPDLIEQTIYDGETAYAAVCGKSLDLQPLQATLSDSARKQMDAIIGEWRRVRPIIEPFARGGGKLAPLPNS